MRLSLKAPCKNCPFSVAETRIRFACRERAEEIEEHAYRNGFPCHLSATLDEDDEDGGYEFGPNTQHCAGAILMFLNDNYDTWPGIGNRELRAAYLDKLTPNLARAFPSVEAFLEANERRTAQGMSAGTAKTPQAVEGEARQPGPKDAPNLLIAPHDTKEEMR